MVSWDPVAWLVALPLEMPYRPVSSLPQSVQAIVVLSGRVYPPNEFRSYPVAGDDTYKRCVFASWLYKREPIRPILVSGGVSREKPYAEIMRELLISNGVPADRIWRETQSGSTHENAVYSARILRRRGVSNIALVLETVYMTRAAECFRKEGITVFPAPIENGTVYFASDDFMPNWRAIQSNSDTLHEIGGLIWYGLHGWI